MRHASRGRIGFHPVGLLIAGFLMAGQQASAAECSHAFLRAPQFSAETLQRLSLRMYARLLLPMEGNR